MDKIVSTHVDFIGDIHGHADELRDLLKELSYTFENGYYKHPSRTAFFCGDFIDRGSQIKEVLEIVKPMIENGSAHTVIGNHEYNAICYHFIADGKPLRIHSSDNVKQHHETISALSTDELNGYLQWFRTLPIYFDNGNFRVVHAQWKTEYINRLSDSDVTDFSDDNFLIQSSIKGTEEFKITDCLLKGEELQMPGIFFSDKGGKERDSYRIKWWKQGKLKCNEALFEFPEEKQDMLPFQLPGFEKSSPVFFGHYWLKNNKPVMQSANACCLDFSVAKKGLLAAYRWDGEHELISDKFKWIKAKTE